MDFYYDNQILATNLRKMLDKKNVTGADLAKYLGVSKSIVTDWLKGRKLPRMDKLDRMCVFFNCTRTDLLDSNEPKEPATSVDEEDIKFALFSGAEEVTDEMWQRVKDFARMVQQAEQFKKEQEQK